MNVDEAVKRLKDRFSGPLRSRDLVRYGLYAITAVLVSVILFDVLLRPHLKRYSSIKNELRAREKLLVTKTIRTKAINELEGAYRQYELLLGDINDRFFSIEESEKLVKDLPGVISEFGNQVVALKPEINKVAKTRAQLMTEYVQSLGIPNEDAAINMIKRHQKKINTVQRIPVIANHVLRMIPTVNQGQMRAIISQTKVNPFAQVDVSTRKIEMVIQGDYQGFVDVLEWLNDQEKIIRTDQVIIRSISPNSLEVETNVTITIYIIGGSE